MSSWRNVWWVTSKIQRSSWGCGRKLAVDEEERDLEERRLLAELLDRDAAVLEDARLAVDVGDRRAARRGVREGRVIRHEAEVVLVRLHLAEVHGLDGPIGDLDLERLAGAVVRDRQGVFAQVRLLSG